MDSESDSFDRLGESSEEREQLHHQQKKPELIEPEESEHSEKGVLEEEEQIPDPIPQMKMPEVRESYERPTTGGKSLINILTLLKRGGNSKIEIKSESRRETIKRMEECSEKIMKFFEDNKEIITFDK